MALFVAAVLGLGVLQRSGIAGADPSAGWLSLVNSMLLLLIQAELLYMFVLSREWTAPRQESRLDEIQRQVDALRANHARFELTWDAGRAERVRDEHALRQQIEALTEVVRRTTLFEDRLRHVELTTEKHGRRIAAMESESARDDG